jgi:hypothetical protein
MALPEDVEVVVSPELLGELTFGDHEDLVAIAGWEDYQAYGRGELRPKMLTAIAYVLLRRKYPEVTVEDVRGLKLTVIRPGGDVPNPTGAGS